MVLGVRPIGTRSLGDSTTQAIPATAPPPSGELSGTDTLVFSGSGNLTTTTNTTDISGTDTLTFDGSGTLTVTTTLASTETTNFDGSGTLTIQSTIALASTQMAVVFTGLSTLSRLAKLSTASHLTNAENKLSFAGYGTFTVEVPVVAPPATLSNVVRTNVTMPTPVLDSLGRPT